MPVELLNGRGGQVVGRGAGGIELPHKRQHLAAQRLLDEWLLVQVIAAEDGLESIDLLVKASASACALKGGAQLVAGQLGCLARCRREGEDRAGISARESAVGLALKRD